MSGGRWLDGYGSDWLPDVDDEPAAPRAPAPRPPPAAAAGDLVVVPFVPVQCRECGSQDVRCTGRYPPKRRRYHQCRACGAKFASEEVDPALATGLLPGF